MNSGAMNSAAGFTHRSIKAFAVAVIALPLVMLGGCSTVSEMLPERFTPKIVDEQARQIVGFQTEDIQPWQLIPDQFNINKVTHKLVHVNVNSEARSSLLRRLPTVPVDDLRVALKDSIDASGLFRKTEYPREADFNLDVTVLPSKIVKEGNVEYFWSPARWKLSDRRTGEVLFSEQIVKWHQVSLDETPNEVIRNTQLLEGAVRKNIQEGLEQLADVM